jgi:hypothetical protein
VVDRVIGDAGQHVTQIELRVETVELRCADQAVDRGGSLASGIGAGEPTAVMRIVANRRKWQRKLKREGESELPPFHQNLLIPLDFSRLRQIVIKLGSRLLTEGLQFDCHLDIPTKRARRLGPKDVRTIFGPPSVQFKRLVAARVSV